MDPNTDEFYLRVSRISLDFTIFGISMETKMASGEEISSGILWNSCIFDKNESKFLQDAGLVFNGWSIENLVLYTYVMHNLMKNIILISTFISLK